MCGEYGEKNGRPHYHALLFNTHFDDAIPYATTGSNSRIFTSKILQNLWGMGFTSLGHVNYQSAAYVARYVMKKITGDKAEEHYRTVNIDTAEIHQIKPEYNRMSLKTGIGAKWYEKYQSDVYPHDNIVHDGQFHRVPRYYDKKLKQQNPELHAKLLQIRVDKALEKNDNTYARLQVKETVTNAKLNQLKRTL